MKLISLFTVAIAALVSFVTGHHAIVKSLCTFPVYLQSFPYDGSAAGPFTVLKPGAKAYVEAYRDGGSTIKLSKSRTLASPLFSSYTNQPARIFYSLDAQFGNPFLPFRNKLIPTSPACQRFNCGPNNSGCYSYGGSKVFGCAKPVNVTTTLCA